MSNRTMVVNYKLTETGQKSEIIAGRSGEQNRSITIEVDDELMAVVQISKDGQLYVNGGNYGYIVGMYMGTDYNYIDGRGKTYKPAHRVSRYDCDYNANADGYLYFNAIPTPQEMTEALKNVLIKERYYALHIAPLQAQADAEAAAAKVAAEQKAAKVAAEIAEAQAREIAELLELKRAGKLQRRNARGQWEIYNLSPGRDCQPAL